MEYLGPKENRKKYSILLDTKLGEGAFGVVHKGLDNEKNQYVVIKKYKKDNPFSLDPKENYKREVNCLKSLLEECEKLDLICYQDNFKFNNEYYIVTPLLEDYITLYDFLVNEKYSLSKERSKKLKDKIEERVDSLHKKGIRHGDLHEGNIMIHPTTDDIKFIDLGLCGLPHQKEPGWINKFKEYYSYFMIILEKHSIDNLFYHIDQITKAKNQSDKSPKKSPDTIVKKRTASPVRSPSRSPVRTSSTGRPRKSSKEKKNILDDYIKSRLDPLF